jgi:hypothetical protein
MITVIILATIAVAIVGFTIVTALRDGYGRSADRMWASNLEGQSRTAVSQSTSASRLA